MKKKKYSLFLSNYYDIIIILHFILEFSEKKSLFKHFVDKSRFFPYGFKRPDL